MTLSNEVECDEAYVIAGHKGQPAVLQSRAWDEAGNAQPLRADFVVARGETKQPLTNPVAFPNQHYNSLTSWAVDGKGEIKHVYA